MYIFLPTLKAKYIQIKFLIFYPRLYVSLKYNLVLPEFTIREHPINLASDLYQKEMIIVYFLLHLPWIAEKNKYEIRLSQVLNLEQPFIIQL